MRIFAIIPFVLIASFVAPFFVFAATSEGETAPAVGAKSVGVGVQPVITPPGTNITLANPLKGGGNVQTFLLSILDFVIKMGTIVVILMMVLVGYKFVAAQGEPGKITEARDMLLWTIVGALILLGSKAIALGIEKTVQALSTG